MYHLCRGLFTGGDASLRQRWRRRRLAGALILHAGRLTTAQLFGYHGYEPAPESEVHVPHFFANLTAFRNVD